MNMEEAIKKEKFEIVDESGITNPMYDPNWDYLF